MDAALIEATLVRDEALAILSRLGVPQSAFADEGVMALSPITGELIAHVRIKSSEEVTTVIGRATQAFNAWRTVPAPRRGEFVRVLGEESRAARNDLGRLVTLETGKIVSEGLGEVQEMIDICDFAVGLSRQLYGCTIATERADHRMMETWHPLGVCGVISAFNFPVAVWSWNAALAFICGDPVVWKPSEKTPLTALATQAVVARAMRRFGNAPDALSEVVIGGRDIGQALVADARVAVVSATGSTVMGRDVGPRLAARFARAILELGGNNAAIVAASADLDVAVRAIAFAAMGTAGQRCTTLRRLFVHDNVYERLDDRFHETENTLNGIVGGFLVAVDRTRSGIMAGWRQAVALAMTGEEMEALTALSRSRTNRQAGCRGQRRCSAIGRSHRSLPWDEDLACIIRRCSAASSERWPMARLRHSMTDRDRQKPMITPEAKAWLVSLACDKAKEHGDPHELWTTRLLARQRASADRRRVTDVSPVWLKAPCASFSVKRKSSRTRRATIWNAATPSPAQDGGSLCVYREVQVLKKAAAKAEKSKKPVAIVSYDEKPGIQAIATTAPHLPPAPGRHASFARNHEYKNHGTLSLLAGIDLLTGKVHALVREPTAAASSSNSSSFSMPPIRPAPRSS